jgi:hypothetical protein
VCASRGGPIRRCWQRGSDEKGGFLAGASAATIIRARRRWLPCTHLFVRGRSSRDGSAGYNHPELGAGGFRALTFSFAGGHPGTGLLGSAVGRVCWSAGRVCWSAGEVIPGRVCLGASTHLFVRGRSSRDGSAGSAYFGRSSRDGSAWLLAAFPTPPASNRSFASF